MANPTAAAPQNVEIKQGAGYHQIYANNVAVRASNWDFLLDFGKIVSASDKGVTAEAEVGVFLSPPQAKALVTVLTQTVSEYEKRFGAIPTEPKK
jgi:flagellar protein FlaG